MFRHLIIAGAVALAAGPALGQAANDAGNPAYKNSAPMPETTPARGRNSFTEKQALHRLAKAGYMASSLTKTPDGVWTGTATKGGKSVTVGLDFKGNITER